jgi:hypothetical protein
MSEFKSLLRRRYLAALFLAWLAAGAMPGWTADSTLRGGWAKVSPPATVTGIDGASHSAACTGYPGTDPSYHFYARKGKSRNLVVYFEGGGACWDSSTCTFPDGKLPESIPQLFSASLATSEHPADLQGVFDFSRVGNPVRDWGMVYVPYCTADLHAGSATRVYENVGHPVYDNLPSSFAIRHNGYSNTMVVLDWIRRNVAAPDRILVMGSSAGGYAASIHFPWLRQMFPAAQVFVLADASQGVTTPTWDQSTPGRGSWSLQLPPWSNDIGLVNISGPELLRLAAQSDPSTRVAQFTTVADREQAAYYGEMKLNYGPGGSCDRVLRDWNRQMVATASSYASTLPNYRHYLAAGFYHTILTGKEFYVEQSAGPSFNAWLGAMLDGAKAWRNLACPGCLIALPCRQ